MDHTEIIAKCRPWIGKGNRPLVLPLPSVGRRLPSIGSGRPWYEGELENWRTPFFGIRRTGFQACSREKLGNINQKLAPLHSVARIARDDLPFLLGPNTLPAEWPAELPTRKGGVNFLL